jgi:Rrf2 family protein
MQIMVYLARNKSTVSSTELSDKLHISQRYVLQIAGKLREGDLITTRIGMSGGYTLGKKAAAISAYDVIAQMEGDLSIPECLTYTPDCEEPCKRSNLLDTLSAMNDYLNTYLKTITFDKLEDMNITGRLSEILGLVEAHTDEIRQKG